MRCRRHQRALACWSHFQALYGGSDRDDPASSGPAYHRSWSWLFVRAPNTTHATIITTVVELLLAQLLYCTK